jgi:hypothetical protein
MGEPPRGTYYPASPGTGNQPPRHYQFNATNPWEREEREKVLKYFNHFCMSVDFECSCGVGIELIFCFVILWFA